MKSKLLSAFDFIAATKETVYLYENLWKENKMMLLHGKREADKTSAAVDMAIKVASEGRDVVFIDTEDALAPHVGKLLSTKNLFVFQPGFENPDDRRDYADIVISSIEEIIATTGIKVFVINSITRIAALSFGRNASPSYIMKRLALLQMRHGVSLAVIAHDTTKSVLRSLANYADSMKELYVADENQQESSEEAPSEVVTKTQHTPRQMSRKEKRALKRLHAKQSRIAG